MLKFISLEQFKVKGKGIEHAVENPSECFDFSHIVGQVVEINGCKYKVKGVNRFAHNPPWHEGEKIGLLV